MSAELSIERNVPLAPLTTLELGGRAEFFLRATTEGQVRQGLKWARDRGCPALIVGGGSNLVVADSGVPGLVIHVGTRGCRIEATQESTVKVKVEAGEPWDAFVTTMVDAGYAGIECLSGIPGYVGATPIQNVGAYGQEVSDSIVAVRVIDRHDLSIRSIRAEECAFGYRDSRFKHEPDRFVVLGVTFSLVPKGPPIVKYPELVDAIGTEQRSLVTVRDTVRRLRAAKSMLIDPADENRRSAGSFFTNPIMEASEARRVFARAVELGVVDQQSDVPRYPATRNRLKIPAAWLIERSGIAKGFRRGAVGISSKHTLALVHHGGGSTDDLLELASLVRRRVWDTFGVTLQPEPSLVGGIALSSF